MENRGRFNCDTYSATDYVEAAPRYHKNGGVYVYGVSQGNDTQVNLSREGARAFALEILRLCGDEQPAETPKAEPVPTKALLVRKNKGGTLEALEVYESTEAAKAKAELFAGYNTSAAFIVFTPVAEAKATVTVDLTYTPTI